MDVMDYPQCITTTTTTTTTTAEDSY